MTKGDRTKVATKKAGKAKRVNKPRGVQLELFPQSQQPVQQQVQQTEPDQPPSSTTTEPEPKLSYEDRVAAASLVAAQYNTKLDRGLEEGGGAWHTTHDTVGFGDAISLMLTLRSVSKSHVRMASSDQGWLVSVLLA